MVDRSDLIFYVERNSGGACQTLRYAEKQEKSYAIVSFEERTIRPLIECYTWFSAGEYGINCEFKENGDIDLLIHYCASRYK